MAHAERHGWEQDKAGRNSELMGLGTCQALAERQPKATIFIRGSKGVPIWNIAGQSGITDEHDSQAMDEWRQSGLFWRTEPGMGRVADGIPSGMDRLRSLGNAVVPQVAEWIGKQILRAAAAPDASCRLVAIA